MVKWQDLEKESACHEVTTYSMLLGQPFENDFGVCLMIC